MGIRHPSIVGVVLLTICGLLPFSVPSARTAADTLALFSLRPTNMEAMGYDGDIVFSLTAALEGRDQVMLMPRREMEDRLYQEGMVQGDNLELVSSAGRALGVSYILYGQVTKTGAAIAASMKLLNVRSGRVVRTWSPTFTSRDDLLAQMPLLAEEIAEVVVGGGDSGPSAPSDTAAVADPQEEKAIDHLQADAADGEIRVSWEISSRTPIREIQVYRSQSQEGPYQLLGLARGNRFVDAQVSPGRSYFYRLVVKREDGRELRIPRTVEIRYPGEKQPSAPLILDAEAGVRWAEIRFVPSLRNEKNGFSIVRYHLYRKDGEEGDWKRIASVKAASRSQFDLKYTLVDPEGLEDGMRYFYAVSGEDAQGVESPRSDSQSLATAPRPVLAVERQGLLRRIQFSWEPIDGVEGYRLYRKSGDESWKRVETARGAEKSSVTDDSGLDDGRTYSYYLTAYDDRGETGPSPAVVAETKPTPPAPAGLTAEAGGVKSVPVRWQPVEDPDVKGYAVYRREGDGGSFKRIARVREKTAYLDKGTGFTPLKDGTAYTYQVAAFNRYDAEGESAGPVTARTKPRPKPVMGLTAVHQEDRVVVQWESGTEADIQKQVLSRSQNQGFWSELAQLPAGRNSYEDGDVKPGASYRYRVVLTDSDGLKSDAAESAPVTVP